MKKTGPGLSVHIKRNAISLQRITLRGSPSESVVSLHDSRSPGSDSSSVFIFPVSQ